jgi:hypothetical protein
MSTSPPSSQKADVRPISFVLDDQATGAPPVSVNLAIRPEDLTRSDSSRVAVQQTLGGAWGDNFGPGIPTITISGHTGWRRNDNSTDDLDGEGRFTQLYQQVFTGWHTLRKVAVQYGQDPDGVQLVFADALDNFAVVVAPLNFTLRRSRSRPLLFQYQISMVVLDQNIDQAAYLQFGGASADLLSKQALGLDSLSASIDELAGYITNIQNFLDRTIAAPVKAFMFQTQRLFESVKTAIAAGNNVAGTLINVAGMAAQAGINIFRTAAAVSSLTSTVRARLMQVAGAYTNIFCVLKNALNQQIYYPDYTPLFGSSNCSSTSGGRPISVLSGQNPFYSVFPVQQASPFSLTSAAQTNLRVLASSDTVLAPMTTAQLGSAVSAVNEGMAVA